MNNSIRKYKNTDEIIDDLVNRKLIFPDESSKKIFRSYLIQYGYFSFIKVTSNDLMYQDIENKIFKPEFSSNNLRYLFDIDRNNSYVIFKYFRNIEFLLNNSLLKVISRKLNKLVKCPYIAALDSESLDILFPNIDQETSHFKKRTNSTYINFYDDLFKNFNNQNFDCRDAIQKNKLNEGENIKNLIKNGWFNKHINNIHKRVKKDWEYLDIFSLFQIITFSQSTRLFSYLSTSLKNEVIKEFCFYFNPINKYLKLKEKTFTNLILIFSNLRNLLMHNGYLMKFNFKIDEETKDNLENYFNMNIQTLDIKLNDIITIMESIIGIKEKIFDEINYLVKNKIKNRTDRNDNISLLLFEIIEKESRIKINIDLSEIN